VTAQADFVALTLVTFVLTLLTNATPLLAAGRPVGFTAADGTTLAAMLYESNLRPSPGIVLVHMLGRSKDEWALMAERLQDAGATVLAFDLRGHGSSAGSASTLGPMAGDVSAAIDWLATRPNVRPGAVAVVGASLGANLAAIAAASKATVRAVALLSPSLDYRGVRLDAATMKRLGARPVWLAASSEDPYALRTLKELVAGGGSREQYLSSVRAHGTTLLTADPDLARTLMDWLRRTLIF
jgi:alpha-beta hydrolase superfamily lysophospholipase